MRTKILVAGLLSALFCSQGYVWCQVTGTIQGTVTDPSGAVVPGAGVTASTGPALVRTTVTDSQGKYTIGGLAAGTYVIHASANGFADYDSKTLDLRGGSAINANISLALVSPAERVSVVDQADTVSTDPVNNANAQILGKPELAALPDDPDDLIADLLTLAGPAAGPNGAQIFIDGFTGGLMPPKQAIREIRINQNPFGAQYDKPGQARVEILTKPGSDEFHGNLLFQFSDAALNSRNTFVASKPPYQRRQWEGEVGGPLSKKTSFFSDFEYRSINENAFVNAVTLDRNFNTAPLTEAVVTPLTNTEINFKIDRQLSPNHTLTARYTFARDRNDNQGVGGVSLPQRAYNVRDSEDTLQFVETGVLSTHTVNETRFRFRRQHTDQSGGAAAPTIRCWTRLAAAVRPLESPTITRNGLNFRTSPRVSPVRTPLSGAA